MKFDAADLNRRAIREALEFVAAHQGEITKAANVASSSSTKQVLGEAKRVRAQIIDAADQAAKVGLDSAEEQVARQAAAQVEYVRRAVAPLSIDQLSRELAWVLRSDSTDGAKLVATEIVREQAELLASRERRPAPNPAIAQRLLVQARQTLREAQAGPEEMPPPTREPGADSPDRAEAAEDAPPAGVPGEDGQAGLDDLIAAIQEEGEQTRKTLREQGEKTRETIERTSRSKGKITLLLSLATALISFASLYLQTQESPPPPSRPSGESTLEVQGPVIPPAAGPAADGLRLGPPPTPPPDNGQSLGGSVLLRAR